MTPDLTALTIPEIKKLLTEKQVTAGEIVSTYLQRIKTFNPKINAFITVTEKEATDQAKIIDEKISKNQSVGKLAGAVMAVKDIYLTKGVETTAGSKILKGYIPQYSSTIYQKLINEDAILIGKTNTDCFAFGGSTENSGYFTTKNPWNLSLVPGGSSGGSSAAQAASLCTFALGTDTGGSIRQPASLCGVTGIKPTYGRNSRYGITSMAASFDCPGAFGKNVEDVAAVTRITAGLDSYDATTSPDPVPDYVNKLSNFSLKGLRIGLPREYFSESLDPEVKENVLGAAKTFESNGAKIIDISLPSTSLGLAVYYVLIPSEISSNMARYDGIRFGQSKKDTTDLLSHYMETRGEFMEPELKRRILIGTYALSAGYFDAYYTKASKVRTLIKNEFIDNFSKVDVILAPVSPTTAWPIGQKVNHPLQMYLADVYTCCINVAGVPALALPCGFDSQNLPIGFQLIGNYFEESKLFSIGHQYQQLTDYHLKTPNL
ncbi:MAG: Asp-tRNA(Asn)/Glu-tRNA(Gln) amidotransferase subunit GatA [Candidatus Shapirobacteria bacterium]|jgi:aspartyl-tRNA(Asn)/glutamyl-tRNA(Gln) amidotransferase subunit A